jgi:hypothetical protein
VSPAARKLRRGRPPVTGRYGKGSASWRTSFEKTEAKLIRLAAEGAGETPAAYITRVALERARQDLAG